MNEHTPTPWYLAKTEWDYKTVITALDRTQIIARCGSSDFLQAERDAEFIVRSANDYEALRLTAAVATSEVLKLREQKEELLAAAKFSLAQIKEAGGEYDKYARLAYDGLKETLENAIAKAEERP